MAAVATGMVAFAGGTACLPLAPAPAQIPSVGIHAPAGWRAERSANGVAVFTPSDLKPGEVVKVAVFDSALLGGKRLKEWLQTFAGPVGEDPGKLTGPLKIVQSENKIVTGSGVYAGPEGTSLDVVFCGVSLDGRRVHALRVLSSHQDGLLARYENAIAAVNSSLVERAKREAGNTRSSPVRSASGKSRNKPTKEKRYPWVVPTGKGLKPSQIVGVRQWPEPDPLSGLESVVCVVLTDGTLYKGFPVALDEMDVAQSRRAEPEKWGRWRKSGAKYLVAWPDKPGSFEPLPGGFVKPGKTNERIGGRWTGSRTFGGFGQFSSYHTWGVTFTPGGRFTKDSSGGGGTSGGTSPSINYSYGESGSRTSASGDGYVAASRSKSRPAGDRSGTYTIDRYVLTLRYDNGIVTRLPFFFLDSTQRMLWFENSLLLGKRR